MIINIPPKLNILQERKSNYSISHGSAAKDFESKTNEFWSTQIWDSTTMEW